MLDVSANGVRTIRLRKSASRGTLPTPRRDYELLARVSSLESRGI